MALERIKGMLPSGWYVPYDQIEPLPTPGGFPAKYIWQAFPFLKNFYTNYELNYMGAYASQRFWRSMWHVPLLVAGTYLCGIYWGQKAMAARRPWDLRGALAYWNLFLAIFSLLGALRTVPYALYFLSHTSFKFVTCAPPPVTHGERDVGLWVVLFLLSKMLELLDTAFIVLRKRPLMFLHWYHHVTVGLYCYYATSYNVPGLLFVAMNYSVHAVMYGYFYLSAIQRVPRWFNPMWITGAQISQMFVGIYVTAMQALWTFQGTCEGGDRRVSLGALAMYGSYALLFLDFFVRRFLFKGPKKRSAKVEGEGEGQGEGEASGQAYRRAGRGAVKAVPQQ